MSDQLHGPGQAGASGSGMDHEAIDELLAGYVLRTLSGEDAAAADRLLSGHVPTCQACRRTLLAFQDIAGDLALAPPPLSPPDVLLPRLQREMDARPRRRGRRWRPMQLLVAAASVIVVVGLAGMAITQGMSASDARQQVAAMQGALEFAGRPEADANPVGPVTEFFAPGVEEFWIYGTGVSAPPANMVYRVWMIAASGTPVYVGEFLPRGGMVSLRGTYDPSQYERIAITAEPADSEPDSPGEILWHSSSS
jgi:anti-sigma-K factor RskA